MPAQSTGPSADEPEDREVRDSPVTPADRDLLDEDSLLEEQPYASLEEDLETFAEVDDTDPEGPRSW